MKIPDRHPCRRTHAMELKVYGLKVFNGATNTPSSLLYAAPVAVRTNRNDGITFQARIVPVMLHGPSQRRGINVQVAYRHILEEETETGQIITYSHNFRLKNPTIFNNDRWTKLTDYDLLYNKCLSEYG